MLTKTPLRHTHRETFHRSSRSAFRFECMFLQTAWTGAHCQKPWTVCMYVRCKLVCICAYKYISAYECLVYTHVCMNTCKDGCYVCTFVYMFAYMYVLYQRIYYMKNFLDDGCTYMQRSRRNSTSIRRNFFPLLRINVKAIAIAICGRKTLSSDQI